MPFPYKVNFFFLCNQILSPYVIRFFCFILFSVLTNPKTSLEIVLLIKGVVISYLRRHIGKPTICICKNGKYAVTAKLISAFVFATRIVQVLFYLHPKFQASIRLLLLYSLVCVGPGQNPNCWFSHAPREKTGLWPMPKQRADQLCSNCTADQHLCFRYTDSTIPFLPKSKIPSF